MHKIRVPQECLPGHLTARLPQPDRSIITATYECLPIGAPCHRPDKICMPCQGVLATTTVYLPQLHQIVLSYHLNFSGREKPLIWLKRFCCVREGYHCEKKGTLSFHVTPRHE